MKAFEVLGLGLILFLLAFLSFGAVSNPAAFSKLMQSPATPPSSPYAVQGPPTISAQLIDPLLCKYGNPATCGTGADLYNLGVQYEIDPVFPLAFFWNESNFGRAGAAVTSRNLGNLRSSPLEAFESGGYACFYDWQTGYKAWYELIEGPMYAKAGLTTVDQIIPRYAPSGEKNSPSHYIAIVKSAVSLWRSGEATAP